MKTDFSVLDKQSFYPFLKRCRFNQSTNSDQSVTDQSLISQSAIASKKTTLRYVVSLSGGLDSIVLLHLMYSLKSELSSDGYSLAAIYVNHNLSPSSKDWADFCKSLCSSYLIPISILSVNAQHIKRQSPEDAARNARYNALREALSSSDCLLTAHHQNDQAETILLQLFRGSGPKGLCAMPTNKIFHLSILARPLLNFSREQIRHYALQHQLQWVEDESNQQQIFKRNFLRRSILPKLKQQWPGISKTLFRASQIQAEAVSILDEVAQQDLILCELPSKLSAKTNDWFFQPSLNLTQLKTLSTARIKNCLQFWLRKNNSIALNSSLLDEFMTEFIHKTPTPKSQISFKKKLFISAHQHYQLNYFQDKIFLCHNLKKCVNMRANIDTQNKVLWDFNKDHQLSLGDLTIEVLPVALATRSHDTSQLNIAMLHNTIEVKFRQGGERFKKNRISSHFSLKKWLQENSVPPWLRDKIPLFYSNNELFQIGYHIINQDYKAVKNMPSISFILNKIELI